MTISMEEVEKVANYLSPRLAGQDVSRSSLLSAIFSFADKFNLSAMCRFIDWAYEYGMGEGEILSTLVHDINGRNDVCFLPRTDSY